MYRMILVIFIATTLFATISCTNEGSNKPYKSNWLKTFINKIKMKQKLGNVLTIQDLIPSDEKISLIAKLPEIRGGSLDRIQDIGIIVTADKVYFLNLKLPERPEIISSVDLIHDSMYANNFLGFREDYALFSIAYQGVQVINIKDLKNPLSLGLTKAYGSPLKIIFHDNLGITQQGVFEVSDLLNPKILKQFDSPAFYFNIIENTLIFSSTNSIKTIDLIKNENWDISSTYNHEFLYGLGRIDHIRGNYFLTVSDWLGIMELVSDTKIDLKHMTNIEITPDFFIRDDELVFTRTIPYWGNILLSYSLANHLKPKLLYAIDTKDMWYFDANKKYVIYKGRTDAGAYPSEISLFVLKNKIDSLPEFIGSIGIDMSSHFQLIENIIYIFTKEGLELHKIT